eukprot:m.799737 g.799737  ORF g.799737 m.799737 type:complete len:213 (+) comp59264_c0_seq86:1293-1931(+)
MLLNTGTHFGGSFSASPPPIGLGSQQPVPRRGPLATPSSTISRSLDAASTIDGHNPHVSAVSPPHSISPRRRGTLTVPSPTLGFLGDSTDTLEIPVLGSIALSKVRWTYLVSVSSIVSVLPTSPVCPDLTIIICPSQGALATTKSVASFCSCACCNPQSSLGGRGSRPDCSVWHTSACPSSPAIASLIESIRFVRLIVVIQEVFLLRNSEVP